MIGLHLEEEQMRFNIKISSIMLLRVETHQTSLDSILYKNNSLKTREKGNRKKIKSNSKKRTRIRLKKKSSRKF
jgi:hypothetical protein